jgi:hypothetical protein
MNVNLQLHSLHKLFRSAIQKPGQVSMQRHPCDSEMFEVDCDKTAPSARNSGRMVSLRVHGEYASRVGSPLFARWRVGEPRFGYVDGNR